MMKKILLSLVCVLMLSACSAGKTDYEKLSSDVKSLEKIDEGKLQYDVVTDLFEVSLLGEYDLSEGVYYYSVFGMEFYVDETNVYMQALNKWYKTPLTDEIRAELEIDEEFDYLTVEMPEGDEIIEENATGVELIDNAVAGKTYNEITVATEGGYSVAGLEENIDITTVDNQLSVQASDPETNSSLSLTVGKGEKLEIPTEATEGIEISEEDFNKLIEE